MKNILLKLSGEFFQGQPGKTNTAHNICMDVAFVNSIIQQIKELNHTHHINIVIGGGNFFRGQKEGKALGLEQSAADTVGMLATVMNGIILRNLFEQADIEAVVLSAYDIPGIVPQVNLTLIKQAQAQRAVIIFVGGTGNPYFSTDTASIIRALQTKSCEVWKASTVDAVYDDDPVKNSQAKPLKKLTYADVLSRSLKVMDLTAITMAKEHNIKLRVFSIFEPNALLHVAQNTDVGSTIQ
jgi:uridylate kinase